MLLKNATRFEKYGASRSILRDWMNSIMKRETARQRDTINLIPSENIAFPEVLEAVGSNLCNKYSEGYPGKRYYAGNEIMDEVENTAIRLTKEIFRVPFANVQPYSGSLANHEVYEAIMKKDDKFMGPHLFDGGHLTHGWKKSAPGKRWKCIPYHLNPRTGMLDMDAIRSIALKVKPRLIWCGATSYSRMIPFKEFGKIADECGAYLAADISHIAGLVAGGMHRSPHSYAHIITTTTQKTLRGPRAAMIMVTEKGLEKDPDLGQKINDSVFPCMQGGPHMEKIFGIATMLHLISGPDGSVSPDFRNYARQVVSNAIALANHLHGASVSDSQKIKVVSGGTDNHLMVLDLTEFGKGRGVFVQLALETVGIICNKNTIPGEDGSPFYPSGIRIGTPTLTSRGAIEGDMGVLALIISNVIRKTMFIVNGDIEMKNFPEGTKENRALILRKFKKLLDFSDDIFGEEKFQVLSFLKRLE